MRRKPSTPWAPASRTCVPDSDLRALDAAARRAIDAFPIEANSIDRVAVSENVTYRVKDRAGGGSYVLRLHRPAYNTLAQLEAERAWTRSLNAAGVRAPAGVRTCDGKHFTTVAIGRETEVRFAGLTHWIDGVPLSTALEAGRDAAIAENAFTQIGRLAAQMHHQALAWLPPEGFDRPRLDTAGLLGESPRWGRFWEHPALRTDERRDLLHLRDRAIRNLDRYGISSTNFGLIHADLHADNILVQGGSVAIIDFDDSAHGWLVYDLATALVDVLNRPDYSRLREALIRGYEECGRLSDKDLAILDTLVVVRAMSLIGWYAQRPEHADSSYLEEIRRWLRKVGGGLR